MSTSKTDRRGIVYRVLTLVAVSLIAASFFTPGWWVSLTAPNYPEATFPPQGIRILFHMDSVQNGCDIRDSVEVRETEALDCVHEMDTINHYVGMYPIASGGPVEKAFSPFLFAMLGVMGLTFAAPGGRKTRLAVAVIGFGGIAGWMTMALYGEDGIRLHTKNYVEGMVVSLGQDAGETAVNPNLPTIVQMLQQSLAESEAEDAEEVVEAGDRDAMITTLKRAYELDNAKLPAAEQEPWNGSVMQVFKWHYAKSLGRWFNDPERNDPLVRTMDGVAQILYAGVIAFMALMIFAAWSVRSIFHWILVLAPMALPVGFLAEYAGWLWWYGHTLNEMGAFTLKPFMPTVFGGDGKVAQFATHSYPSTGFFLMLASSALLLLAALIRFKQVRLAGEAAKGM